MTIFPAASTPPALKIPPSSSIVKVSILNTGRFEGLPLDFFLQPPIKGLGTFDCPVFSFFIEHASSRKKILFDLGIAKNWRDGPPTNLKVVVGVSPEIIVDKNVSEILLENNIPLESISSIIWSHWHWDHTGDPSTFPATTSLTVGPGFKQAMLPGYPANPDAPILESAYTGRDLVEISFDQAPELHLGRFRAHDYFGDGSFYLLDSPGHTVGHLCGLARTTPETFVFMGADICHHGAEMRPTEYLPLPEYITPNPLKRQAQPCPGSLFLDIHLEHSATKRFYHISDGGASDPAEAERSVEKLCEFDGHDNVFTVIAHDGALVDVVDFFPKSLNDWKARGYREKVMWGFLRDFKDAIEAD